MQNWTHAVFTILFLSLTVQIKFYTDKNSIYVIRSLELSVSEIAYQFDFEYPHNP